MKSLLTGLLLLCVAGSSFAADTLMMPYFKADNISGDMTQVVSVVKQKLTAGGFKVVGEVTPYAGTTIVVVTSDALKAAAAMSDYGIFGAAQRVSITKAGNGIQVAYTNPTYMANAYQMKSDMDDVTAAMNKALGNQGEYGPDKGLSKSDLRDYHYKFLMPYFYDRLDLAEYASYKDAVAAVEKKLAAKAGGVSQVYRIDLPGKQKTLIGVRMSGPKDNDCSGDQYIMSRIDFKEHKSSAHLPYEMIITGKHVYALPAEFRIAISFPDLSMMGSNSFASIMCAPSAIKEALTAAAGGTEDE